MADTTTTNLGLVKPEVGASTDTWGTKVNNDLDAVDALFDAGPVLKVAKGGTGAANAADARTALGLAIGTDVQAYDADTTKNDVANTFTATQTFGTSVVETKVAIAAAEIDLALGNYFTKSSVGTLTLTLTNQATTGSVSAFVLELANGASPAVTFTFNAGSTVTWAAATAPTLTASGTDVLAFFTHDGGTTWRGFVLGLGMGA
jgi:hypothetical protein